MLTFNTLLSAVELDTKMMMFERIKIVSVKDMRKDYKSSS